MKDNRNNKKKSQKSICKHKVAFFTLNSPPLTCDKEHAPEMQRKYR